MTTYHAGGRDAPTIGDLAAADATDRSIIEAVAAEGPYDAETDGKADLLGRIAIDAAMPGLSAASVRMALARLVRRGLIVERERYGVLVGVEATRKGYLAAGVPPERIGSEVGRSSGAAPQHRTDGTDFRTHGRSAEGGPITRTAGPTTVGPTGHTYSPARIKQLMAMPVTSVRLVLQAIDVADGGEATTLVIARSLGRTSADGRPTSAVSAWLTAALIRGWVTARTASARRNTQAYWRLTETGRAEAARAEGRARRRRPPTPTVLEPQPAPTRVSGYPALAAWRENLADLYGESRRFRDRGMDDVADLILSKATTDLSGDAIGELIRLIDDLGGLA